MLLYGEQENKIKQVIN